MNKFMQRAAAGMSVLAVAFGLALGVTASLAGDALARDNRVVLSNTSDCTFAGETYSEGSVIVQGDGKKYKCHDGHWDAASVKPDYGSGWTYPGAVEASQEMAPVNYYP